MEKIEYQQVFVEKLRNAIPHNINLADEIAQVLDLSLDSSYRRLRGETEFTLSETIILCKHFEVPLENLTNSFSEMVSFRTNKLGKDINSFTNYLEGLYKDLHLLHQFEDAEIVYAAEDLPVFYSLLFPLMARFKMCYWTKSILNIPEMQRLKIEDVSLPDSWNENASKMSELFLKVKSTEIWNSDTMKSTYEQIKFYWEAGFFREKQTALDVIDEFIRLIGLISEQAESGKKKNIRNGQFSNTEYALYTSDLMIGNNCVQISAGNKVTTYIGYNSFNYMRTGNQYFNEQVGDWLKNIISKSTMVSTVSEKQRNQFFKNTIQKIESLKQSIIND